MKETHQHLIPRLSVTRPVTVVMVLLALLVVGTIAYVRIPLSLTPQGLEERWLGMWINYPNAGPIEVEQKIARKVEEALATVPRIRKIRTSSERNGCWTSVSFRQETDMREAYNQMRDRADRLLLELPDEVDHIWMRNWDPDDWPILWMGLYLDGEYADPQHLLETYVRPELQRIDGVGQLDIWGGPGKEVFIYTDQEKVRSHRVDLYRVGTQLASHNFTMPAGYVHEGGRKLLVRSLARFESVEQIRQHVVDPQHGLRLQDIAAVGLVPRPRTWFNRINGIESLGCEILSTAEANTVEVVREVRAKLEELKTRPRLSGFDYEIFWDMGKQITESVENLRNTGLWGGLFAAGVLFLFLRAVRMTLIITLAIPLALMISITAIFFLGWTLNLITMMGLMLSLGLVVDNAIVIVENIQRKREEGVEAREASITGAGEVGLAVTMATLTTVVVFLPLILMSDDLEFSFFMVRLGMPVIVGLLASLFIALAIIPLAALRISTGGKRRDSRLIARTRDAYVRCLEWVLGHRIESIILVLAAMATIQIPMQGMTRTDRSSEHRTDLWLGFDMPEGQTLKQADRFISGVEDTLMNHKEEYNFRVLETWSRNSRGRIHMILNEKENNAWYEVAWDNLLKALGWRQSPHLEYEEMVEDIKKRIVLPAGVQMRLNWRSGGSGDAAVAINLYGQDTEVLLGLSREVERRLRRIPGLLSVQTDIDRGSTELEVRLDRGQVQRYGIEPRQIPGVISYSLRGQDLTRFRTEDGSEVDVHFQLEEVDRQGMHQLRNTTFFSDEGAEIPLESLASLSVHKVLGSIRRENRQTVLTVTATATSKESGELFGQIDEAMQGFEMPRGYRWDKGARYERIEETDASRQFALLLSVTFVFLLMGVLFESFILPLSVIIAIPFSFLGVYWTLYLTDTAFDMLCGIGVVILVGVVVNNAIVLIDLANRLRAEGRDRFEALVEAGRHRYRPILMTTFTTVFGLVPMAVGNAEMIGMPYAPLGRTMMGGLLASMVLTLLIVPLCYTLFDDLRQLLRAVAFSARTPAHPEGGDRVPDRAGPN